MKRSNRSTAEEPEAKVRRIEELPNSVANHDAEKHAMSDDDGVEGNRNTGSPFREWLSSGNTPPAPDDAMDLLDETDRRILASLILNVDVTEVFSPERVNRLAGKFGFQAGASMDLTNSWNSNLPERRRRAWREIHRTNPYIIIGSPPCTFVSNLQRNVLFG